MQDSFAKPSVYAFIDNQNLNVGVQSHGWKIDWIKFRKFLSQKYGVSRAFMFIGYVPEYEDMYLQLNEAGYAIVLKPTFDMTRPRPEENSSVSETEKEEKKQHIKGNIDVELVLWAMKESKNYDKAVLVSGDGDFYSLIEYLEERGKLHKIIAPSGQYSRLFNRYEKYIERLDQYKKQLAYRSFKKK